MGRTVTALVTWDDSYLLAEDPASFPAGLPDKRIVAGQIQALLDGPVSSDLSPAEIAGARTLLSRFRPPATMNSATSPGSPPRNWWSWS